MANSSSHFTSPAGSQNSTSYFIPVTEVYNSTFRPVTWLPSTISSRENPNGTSNNTISEDTPELVQLAAYFVPVFFGIIIAVGFTGNSLVITVMTKISKMHGQRLNNTNRFILNLAISDLLFLIFCVPFHATVYTLEGWVFGGFLCVFSKFCEEMAKIASVYSLVALSFDRFLAVAYATSARQIRTRSNAIKGLIFIWIAAVGIATPVVITRIHINFRGQSLCVLASLNWIKWYEFCIALFGYILPLFVIICCYVGLLYTICKTAKKSSVTVSNSSNDSRKKVTRIVVLVVIVFAICWMPHYIVSLWILFDPNFNFLSMSTYAFRLVAHCMAYANSCVNPLVYAFVSKKFRQDFKKACTRQYLSEAVGSVKKFSRRMIGTMRYSWNSSSNSFVEDDSRWCRRSRRRGGATSSARKRGEFCPRSPVTPLRGAPRIVEENTTMLNLEDMKSLHATKGTREHSFSTMRNCRQDTLIEENGRAGDEDALQSTTFF